MSAQDERVAETLQRLKQRFAEADGAEQAPARRQNAATPAPSKAARTTAAQDEPGGRLRQGPGQRACGAAGKAAAEEGVAPAQRNRRHWVVVSYDIPNDRRRTKVMKTLEGFGHRVQYSVFECELRPADLEKLKARLKALMQPEEDDIRFYDLCENCQGKVTMLGRAKMYRQEGSVVV